ncbi:MAG: hypothetical protein KGI00_02165 [Candidatus Micrarchaeota archaeon]|nr:hypothetical protein [Planctomycetota bacterium]MDE1822868.1 hypothetical protein [Candidatus Micrarchaeota archaeon]MDE1849513.1 hypothetical protein [Candidatus Micrarchaeota archaeon]
MDITIRGLQDAVFRKFKAKAAEEDMRLGDALTQAIELWLKGRNKRPKGRLSDISITNWGKGTEHSSTEVDKIVYG